MRALMVWIALGAGAGGALAAQVAAPTAGLERGHRLFDVHCARCHGIGGGGGEGPSLQRPITDDPSDDDLVSVVQNGIPGTAMTGTRSLSVDDARRVVAYVRSLGRVEEGPVPGDPVRGREVYEAQACDACHIVAGEGRGVGPELTTIGTRRGVAHLRQSVVDATAVVSEDFRVLTVRTPDGDAVRGLRVSEDDFAVVLRDADARLHTVILDSGASVRREPGASLMPSYDRRLSATELDDLVAFLASLRGAVR